MDNGWNSEIAVKNVKNVVKNLGLDYHVMLDWMNLEKFNSIFKVIYC